MDQNDVISCLKKRYPDQEIHLIGSGWTSDAFEVGNKIIRVPKAGLEQYEKEVIVLDFLHGKLPVQIPHPKLIKEDEIAYAEHTKIEGRSWNISTFEALSKADQDLFTKDIAHFFATLHAIPVNEIYSKVSPKLLEPYALDSLSCFKKALETEFSLKDITTLYEFGEKVLAVGSSPVLVHKDFWEGNVLVDEKHRLKGVFDWANACIGNREWDFKALYHPAYMSLLDKVLHFYSQETGYKITKASIGDLTTADTLLSIQYFIQNPNLKNTMEKAWQDTLSKVKNALIKVKNQ